MVAAPHRFRLSPWQSLPLISLACASGTTPVEAPDGASSPADATTLDDARDVASAEVVASDEVAVLPSVLPDPVAPTGDEPLVGTFSVRLVPPVAAGEGTAATAGFSAITGKVYDGAVPSAVVWDTVLAAGSCALVVPRAPFCEPACAPAVCVEDGVCLPNPAALAVGTAWLTGLSTADGPTTVAIEPISKGYSTPAGVSLAYPPAAEGAPIRLVLAGGDRAPFSAISAGISPLEGLAARYTLAAGAPLELAWSPASPDASAISVRLDISHHGGTKGKIECEAADTGSLSIDGALIAKLLDLGVAGYPSIVVTRSRTGSTVMGAGRVDLKVYTYLDIPVSVPGVTSCTADTDCDGGQTCRADLTCQ